MPSSAVARSATMTLPPAVSGPKISSPAMSNDSVVTASNRSSRVEPGLAMHRLEEIHHGAMFELHAFRRAGRARRVDHVGEIRLPPGD